MLSKYMINKYDKEFVTYEGIYESKNKNFKTW